MSTVWYFAYGSNMQSATFRGRRRIAPRSARGARIAGWRIAFDKPPLVPIGESFANVVADPRAETFGVLYEIDTADLEHIELTEGVKIGNYDRIAVTAEPLGATLAAIPAFALASPKSDATLLPTARYMALLIEGALEHGLPSAYVEWLRTIPAGTPTEESVAFRARLDEALRLLRK